MTVEIIHDAFTGTNGDSIQSRVPDTAHNTSTWNIVSGTWTIQSGKARQSDLNGYMLATIDPGAPGTTDQPVTISAAVTVPTGTGSKSPGISFRYDLVGNTGWSLIPDATNGVLYLYGPGGYSTTASGSIPAGTYTVNIRLSGTSITCSYGSINIGPITNSGNLTETGVMLIDYFDGANSAGTRSEWDNFIVSIEGQPAIRRHGMSSRGSIWTPYGRSGVKYF